VRVVPIRASDPQCEDATVDGARPPGGADWTQVARGE
jgi:hypothetical protein